MARTLVVFDFDHTIVHGNSDTWVHKAAPGGAIPKALADTYVPGRWLDFMNRIFDYLHQQSVSMLAIQRLMETIPWTEGMESLLLQLKARPDVDMAILSDANEHFIRWILARKGLLADGTFTAIITNSSCLVDDGAGGTRMVVSPYHATPHGCPSCNHNLCKQVALRQLMRDRQTALALQQQPQGAERLLEPYARIAYIGDGANDLCPARMLRPTDIVMPRVGYKLHKLLQQQQKQQKQQLQGSCVADGGDGGGGSLQHEAAYVGMDTSGGPPVQARVVEWSDGNDIATLLGVLLSETA